MVSLSRPSEGKHVDLDEIASVRPDDELSAVDVTQLENILTRAQLVHLGVVRDSYEEAVGRVI